MEIKLRKADTRIFERTFSVLVENEPGVLARIVGLFSARGFNILSLTVGETRDSSMSRMTIVAQGTPTVLEQVNKQLNKLIPVISVLPMSDDEMIVEELMLVKFRANDKLPEFIEKAQEVGKSISLVESNSKVMILRIVANRKQEPEIFKSLQDFELLEICRSGEIAVSKTRNFKYLENQQAVKEAGVNG